MTLLRDAFHIPMIKITYTPHILPTSTLEVVQQHCIHSVPQNKNSMLFMAILSKYQGHGLLKKRIRHMKVQGILKKEKCEHMKVQDVPKES